MSDDPKLALPSITGLLNQPPIMVFEHFTIRPMDGWHLWFEKSDGEGTTIRKIDFLVLLDRFFKEKM